MTQLEYGYCAWLNEQRYPEWLTSVSRLDWILSLSNATASKPHRRLAESLLPKLPRFSDGYVKAFCDTLIGFNFTWIKTQLGKQRESLVRCLRENLETVTF